MSIIHVNQIARKVKELFQDHIDKRDLNTCDQDYDVKILTRCLAAYAVYFSTACSLEEAAKSVVDGGDDNGIDAILHVPRSKQMVIVQSKWKKDGSGNQKVLKLQNFVME